jgi:excisionase family DNA binding protein
MPSGFVEQAAFVSGWPAEVVDMVLSRHLPPYLAAMTPGQRAEMEPAHRVIHRAAKAHRATKVRRRTSDIEPEEFSAPSEHEISTREAAEVLGVTPRQVCRLAAEWATEGLARQVGRTWLVDRDAVMTYQDQQERRRSA